MEFVVYVSWASQAPVVEGVLQAFQRDFRPKDEGVCVWVDEADESLLRTSFDVTALDYESAIGLALSEVRIAASGANLSGDAVDVVACTEEGQARWPE